MSYQHFAMLYDELMTDAPYENWLHFIERSISKYGNSNKRLLDLGCGTGSLSIPLAQSGYQVTGVDLSEEMLAIAQDKSIEMGVNVAYFQQDMRELSGFQPFDVVGIFCDSLNYLVKEEDVRAAFSSIYNQLTVGGLLLFDVHSLYKMNEVFIGQSYCSNEDQISYIWNCFEGPAENSVEHELTFFVKENNLYRRYDEIHYQRTFSVETYKNWVESVGFTVINIIADFTETTLLPTSERIFFIAKK